MQCNPISQHSLPGPGHNPPFGGDLAEAAAAIADSLALRSAAQNGRADPAADNDYALRIAVELGYHGVIRAPLSDGRADPNTAVFIAVCWAKRTGPVSVLQALLDDGRVDTGAWPRV